MNMQQLMIQAQKMQRELKKAKDQLHEKEFSKNQAGVVTVTVKGDKSIQKIDIDKDALEDKEMVEEMIVVALNELFDQIDEEEAAIEEKLAGGAKGFGF
ncbi:MAG: YbaB/EbfC family nucleoid-associated protein [Erysipelotrichaceae bacterium]|nr:YbaB/EbfC family nucleoid-associated protein [Erysipelotrichaceae bacterium]